MRFIGIVLLVVTCVLVGCSGSTESVIPYEDVPRTGDIANGEVLYNESIDLAPSCISCHNEDANAVPMIETGYSEIAAQRVEGQDAHEYTFYAIAEPGQHIVEGYGNAMYNQYDEKLTPQQMADLIAYLLSL